MNSSDLRSPDAESRRQRKLEHKRRRMERLPDHVNHGSAWLRDIRARWRAAILRIGKDLRPLFDGILVRYAAFDDTGFPDPEYFPWVKELEAKTDVIRSELDRILAVPDRLPPLSSISPDHSRIAKDQWKAFFLYGYGHRSELGCGLCPETARAVERIPRLESAFFSILLPGMHIKRHRGPTKSLVVGHLGVRIPQDGANCVMRVDDEIRSWQAGKVLVFDDTHEHEVWNNTDEIRVVLLIHVRRPLRFPGSLVGSFIYHAIRLSPFVRDGRRNLAEWEARYQAADAA